MSQPRGPGKRFSEGACDAPSQRGRTFYRDLLAENRAGGELEAVPTSGNPQARISLQPTGQVRIALETLHDRCPVGIEIEHGANPFDHKEERMGMGKFDAHEQRVRVRAEGDFEISVEAIDGNSPSVSAGLYYFHARSGACSEKIQHALPVIGRAEMKPERILVPALNPSLVSQMPDLRGSPVIDVPDTGVEAPHATESRSESNLVHGQRGLVDQLFGKVQAARLSDRNGSRAQMPEKQSPKVARADSQTLGQDLDATIFQSAFADQAQSSSRLCWTCPTTPAFRVNSPDDIAGMGGSPLRPRRPRSENSERFFPSPSGPDRWVGSTLCCRRRQYKTCRRSADRATVAPGNRLASPDS